MHGAAIKRGNVSVSEVYETRYLSKDFNHDFKCRLMEINTISSAYLGMKTAYSNAARTMTIVELKLCLNFDKHELKCMFKYYDHKFKCGLEAGNQ